MILELLLESIDWIAMHPPGLKIGKISMPIDSLCALINTLGGEPIGPRVSMAT
jgi:hypothetical protein